MAIKSEISLDSSKAEADAARAGAAITNNLAKSTKGAFQGLMSGAESGMTKLSSGLSVFTAAFQLLDSTISNADSMGDLKDGLDAVLPSMLDINAEMEKLTKLADSPGLEFESVTKAHATFLALGKSSEESMRIIKEIGNALQLGGGDPTQLTEIVSVLTKMTDKGEANIKMIMALADQMPLFRKAFTNAFGDASLKEIEAMGLSGEEFISRFTNGLSQLATAQKDAADRMGDLKDAGKRGSASVVGWVTEAVTNLTDLSRLAAAKITEAFGGNAQGLYNDILGAPAKGGRTAAETSPESIEADRQQAAGRAKIAAMEKLAIIEKEARLQTDLNDSKFKEGELQEEIVSAGAMVENSLLDAYESQKEQSDELQTKLDIARKMKDLVDKTGAGEDDVKKFLKDQVAASRDLKELQEGRATVVRKEEESAKKLADLEKERLATAEKLSSAQENQWDSISKQQEAERKANQEKTAASAELAKRARDNEILEAKSKGHDGKAGRLQKAADIADKQKELEAMGMSPAAAKKQAAREVQTSEDQEFRSRTGRSRIHGSRPDQEFGSTSGLAHSAFQKGATTKLTPAEIAGSQGGGSTKVLEGLAAAIKTIEAAAKKYTASNLNTAN